DISARKLAEEELIRSLGWQQAIFEGSRDAIFITDANATLVDVNRAACMLSGYSKRELLTMRIPDLHEDIDLEAYRQFHDRIMAGEEIISEAQILKKDGSKVDAEFNNRRVVIAGRPYMHTVARDVAERKRAESELQKLTRAVEQSPVCVMITDTKGNIEYVNPRFSQLTGYTSAEVIGQTPRILKSGAQTTDFYKGLWKNISDGNEWRGEFCNKKKNGELYWEFASICSIRDQQRRITHFLAVKEDITERKRFESDLKKSEEKFRTLFEVSQDAVLITLPHGKILDINPAGVKMFGYSSREDFLAMGNAAALYAKPAERSPVVDLLTTQGFVKNYEVKLQKKNGAPLDVSLSSFAVRDEHGQIRFFCGNLHDLTQRKKIEHQLLQAQKMETIATLVSGIAHDFNNLLIAILGNIEFARADADANDPIQHYLQRVEVAAAKARDLINKLMSFSRQQALDPKPINLNRTIEDLLSMLQSMVGRDIGIETRLATPLPDIVADPVQFQQILMNLCVNARDAMPAGGRILLTTSRVDAAETKGLLHANGSRHYVLLTISDTGEGMDKEMLPRIFEPFFTTKEIGRGTGLGLSVVYGIVKQHKGYIEVESEKDKGTTFKIYFPAFLAAEDDTQRDSAEKMPEISSDDLNMALTKETIDGNGISN
ncbi:MAG TPA: PAS domain S-box protein, partial [bacterium]